MAAATNTTVGTVTLNGDLHGSIDPYNPELTPTGVTPGTYKFADVVVDSKGRIIWAQDGDPTWNTCATDTTCGLVIVGDNLNVSSGEISIPLATTSSKGVVTIGSGFKITGSELELDYPLASNTAIGFVSVPVSGNIDIDGSGNISVPISTTTVAGLISVPGGDGLTVDGNGVLTFTPTIQIATNTSTGGVIVPSSGNIDVDVNGNISISECSSGVLGVASVGTNLTSSNGVVDLATGTTGTLGVLSVGENIDVTAGEISIATATNTIKGLVKSGNTDNIVITNGSIDIGTNVPSTDVDTTWTAAQNTVATESTESGTITFDANNGTVFELTTTTTSSIDDILNSVVGDTYDIIVHSNGHLITFNGTKFKISGDSNIVGTSVITCTKIGTSLFNTIVQPNFI
jgi:hypothetical protein